MTDGFTNKLCSFFSSLFNNITITKMFSAKTLTLNKLMLLAPPGTMDPAPHLYDTTMYSLGGLMAVAAASHYMVKPMKVVDVSSVVVGGGGDTRSTLKESN